MTAAPATRPAAPPQSLARGATGTALLRVEQALTGSGTWAAAHAAIKHATVGPLDASPNGSLFHGAPALLFVLHAASADGHPRYQAAIRELAGHVERIAGQRTAAAHLRQERGGDATFREYDLFSGLTGLGALVLRISPGSEALAAVLRYLTRISRPRATSGMSVPGWWTAHDPDPLMPTPGGHANLGTAHGAAGILACLSLAAISGRTVDGQHEAIGSLLDFFARWRQGSPHGPWWPQWLTRDDLRAGHPTGPGPGRASWCYGTPGIARALQLAAIAIADPARQASAERDLAASLGGPQFTRLADGGLCHGVAGAYQTAVRAAADAVTPAVAACLPALATALTSAPGQRDGSSQLLTGGTGVQLALETARRSALPLSGWDRCLLLA